MRLVLGGLCGEVSVHQAGQITADGQAKPGAPMGSRHPRARLLKGCEQAFQVLGVEPTAGVLHRQDDATVLVSADAKGDGAGLGELDGVRQQVVEDLA